MTPNPEYHEAVAWLENRINYETFQAIPYTELENRLTAFRGLLEFLGSPDRKYAVVHVAGTKGKGSTCILLEQILHQAGYRTGRFSSPHLHSLMERFTIDGVHCEESLFAEILFDLKNRIENWESTHFLLTYFELTTLFAFEYFARQNVEIAVVEVGLGGRLDSTNVCLPAVSIITSISYDHVELLGPTLADIAREKAGIIKPGVPVVSGVRDQEPANAIRTIAASRGVPLREWGRDFSSQLCLQGANSPLTFDFLSPSRCWMPLESPVWGEHQARNASLAIAATMLLEEQGWNIPEEAVRRGLQSVRLPARVEIRSQNPLVIVDGAHNRESVRELVETLKVHYRNEKGEKILLFGSMLDKDNDGMLQELVQYFDWIIFTQPSGNPRACPAQKLYEIAISHKPEIGETVPNAAQAFAKATTLAGADDLICVTGSFYLAAEIRSIQSR
ncbi:MAG: bifunctional folylpolyglutamate synthase/dihydrofolate synthase [Planctomycetaceae bacterium]|nr:bifunctional folylpolyglutamate synthase/dihydrofolate synthase [Planctomycetaceae bacterium]